jgi:hypothetical protein
MTLLKGTTDARCRSLEALRAMASDMVDIRAAQPAIVVAMLDADARVRRLATELTAYRADEGCDVRLAFAALLQATQDTDAAVRKAAWLAVSIADGRHAPLLEVLRDAANAALGDADAEIRTYATKGLSVLSGL